MTPFSRPTATGQTMGASFSARQPTTAGEREDQLFERSELRSRTGLGGQSGGYVAKGTDSLSLFSFLLSPVTPSWPPPGARVDPPRGTFWSALHTMIGVLVLIESTAILVSEFTVSTSSQPSSPASTAGTASSNLNVRLEKLPQEVLSRICAISVTNDSKTRPALQATSSLLFHTLRSTPDAWDTLEVMTGTAGCLTTPQQVEEYVKRSRARPLSVALTVAGPQQQQDHTEPENVHGIIESVVGAASRIEDLILDVHSCTSEHALIRLFSPPNVYESKSILRRLALVGNFQLDYILSSLSLLRPSPSGLIQDRSLTHPVFSSLKHLTIAYCPVYSLDTTMNTVESLKLGVTFLAPRSSGGSLVGLLRAFPSLRKVELQTLTYMPGYHPRICEQDSNANGDNAILQLDDLEHLVLDSIPLDCEVFASLRCPHVRKLVLKEVQPDDTDEALAASAADGGWDVVQRFEEFVARHDWSGLEVLEVDRVYERVGATCIELVKMAEGRLKELTLGGFAWDTCESLMTPFRRLSPDAVESPTSSAGDVLDAPRHFPTLERLIIRLDETENHHQLARQAWMDGLEKFALGRIAYDTIVDVLFRGYQHAPKWLQAVGKKTPGWRLAHEDGLKYEYDPDDIERCRTKSAEASTRTLTHISLETSFKDSYTFIWNDYEHLKDIYEPRV
jgi:hypothetical protein